MLQRIRQVLRRSPGLCLALALLAFGAQGAAATLHWCLHAGDDSHVASAVEPCHAAELHAAPAPQHDHCHTDAPGVAHVAAASDSATTAAPAVPAAPLTVLAYLSLDLAWAEAPRLPSTARWRPGLDAPRPVDVFPGESARLLI